GGADLIDVLAPLDHPLAAHVPALLGPDLVLQKAPGRPSGDQFVDGPDDVERIAVAGVGVHDDGNGDAPADAAGALDDLGLREQPHVRLPDGGGRHAVAGDEAHRKPDTLHDL